MFTPDETKALFTRVMDLMVEARWLHSHVFTDGKGHHLVWTTFGTERAVCLNKIADTYRLTSDDRAAYVFDVIAHRERLPSYARPMELDETLASFWRESIGQLRLHGDEDGLLALVHILAGWTPDAGTPVRFEVSEK